MASPPCTAQKYSESNGDVPRYIWVNLSIELTRLLSFRMEVVTRLGRSHTAWNRTDSLLSRRDHCRQTEVRGTPLAALRERPCFSSL